METMILVHETHGHAFTLPAAAVARRLRVVEGRAWVTQTLQRRRGPAPADLWLAPGAVLELPAGSAWVVQAEGDLRLRLCEPGPAAAPSLRAALRRAWQRLRSAPRPALP
jgi:hypothetical protein